MQLSDHSGVQENFDLNCENVSKYNFTFLLNIHNV